MSANDDFTPPPSRPMPPDVRNRIRTAVRGGIRPPGRPKPIRARTPLVVAGGVAVVALGASILTQSLGGSLGAAAHPPTSTATAPPGVPDGTPPPLDSAAAAANLDRCWAAVRSRNKADAVPDRSAWRPVFAVSEQPDIDITVTVARANGKPLICETTRTTVTVSDPNAKPADAPGTRTGALLTSMDGVVAGVMDPTWSHMQFVSGADAAPGVEGAETSGGGSGGGPGFYQDHIFVDFSSYARGPRTWYTVQRFDADPPQRTYRVGDVSPAPDAGNEPAARLPAAPAPLVETIDRPDPGVDRTSPAGQALGQCIAHGLNAVPDAASWTPVLMGGPDYGRFVLARSGNRMATCDVGTDYAGVGYPSVGLRESTRSFASDLPIQFSFGTGVQTDSNPNHRAAVLFGILRSDAAELELIQPNGAQLGVAISNNTFYAAIPGYFWTDLNAFRVIVRDAKGREIYGGPIDTDY